MPEPLDIAAYLKTLAYFRGMSAADSEALAQHAIRRTYAAGEMLFSEDEPASGVWIIEQGRVKVFKLSPDGGEHVLMFLGDKDTFNEIGALQGANPANASALSNLAVWIVPSDAIERVILSNPLFARQLIRFLAKRVHMLVGRIEELALYAVTVRLARFLLKQNEEPSLSGPGITRVIIAAHLATTPQTISIALRELEQSGAIRFDRHRIWIASEELLRSIAML